MEKYAIFGLGISNRAVLKVLGDRAVAWDDRQDVRDDLRAQGYDIRELSVDVLKGCAALVLAPGVPLHFPKPHKIVEAARAAGIEIICDIELFMRMYPDTKTIGITGTNGKSTTTALIAHILNAAGQKAQAVGNIGTPIFDVLDTDQTLVIELSSYQLDLCPTFHPDIAVLLNVTPDHLDRHGSMEAYRASKERMLEGVSKQISYVSNEEATRFAAHQMGVDDRVIEEAMQSFQGLPHRQYHVRKIEQISYINDSKATNAVATQNALQRFENIYLILGGKPKHGGIEALEKGWDHVRHVYLMGLAQDMFAQSLASRGIPHTKCDTLSNATLAAHKAAQHEGGHATVLLSPACSSSYEFNNFEERGAAFEEIVRAL